MNGTDFYRISLKEELSRRCDRNPRYSIRSFARTLGIDAGALSRILSGKQIPSFKMTQTFLNTLDLTPEEQEQFLASIAETHRARAPIRLGRGFKRVKAQPVRTTELSIDTYRVIADWYHAAIMELTFTNGFDSSPKAIAQELGITELEASLAIDRLIRLELMESRNGRLVKTNLQLSTADKHLTTPALRKNQRQFLEKAIESLEDAPIERRSMTSMTMAVNESKMPEAKQLIREFNRKLCSLLESGKRGRVYNLSIALYPLQKEQE